MKKILLIATGGTIASRETEHGLRPVLTSEDMRAAIDVTGSTIEVVDLLSLDSTNIAPCHWQTIARKIAEFRTNYDGFIITHGTDTMAYTAAALYYMLENIDRPVVLTGSQRPLGTDGSDAEGNLRLAYEAACSAFAGVCPTAMRQRKCILLRMTHFAASDARRSTSPPRPHRPPPFICTTHSICASPSCGSTPV